MMPTIVKVQAPVPPPSYQRALARLSRALHMDALTLVTTLHVGPCQVFILISSTIYPKRKYIFLKRNMFCEHFECQHCDAFVTTVSPAVMRL